MKAERKAKATWEGDLPHGKGQIQLGSGAVPILPVTWASRVERSDGKTSPEELIAAAHASCYSMALTLTLANSGHKPTNVQVNAICTLEEINGAPKISTLTLDVQGKVAGLDEAGFAELAHKAEQLCPVSNALRNNVAITLHTRLEA